VSWHDEDAAAFESAAKAIDVARAEVDCARQIASTAHAAVAVSKAELLALDIDATPRPMLVVSEEEDFAALLVLTAHNSEYVCDSKTPLPLCRWLSRTLLI